MVLTKLLSRHSLVDQGGGEMAGNVGVQYRSEVLEPVVLQVTEDAHLAEEKIES